MKPIVPTRAQLKEARVLVVGDSMLDRYWFGAVERISPEAPVPVVRVNTSKEQERLGGAANVAWNVKALGAHPSLLTAIGDDEHGRRLGVVSQREIRDRLDQAQCDLEIGLDRRLPGSLNRQCQRFGDSVDIVAKRINLFGRQRSLPFFVIARLDRTIQQTPTSATTGCPAFTGHDIRPATAGVESPSAVPLYRRPAGRPRPARTAPARRFVPTASQ